MKLTKRLKVNGVECQIVDDMVTLNLSRPGRSVFSVVSPVTLSGVVELSMGYDPQRLHRYFIGYVENSMTTNVNVQRLMCRELTGVLDRITPFNLRHVSLLKVLKILSELTALKFVIPEKANVYLAPYFYSWGGGYHVMDSIGRIFGFEKFMWQAQGDGRVFVGPWSDSYWSNKPVELGAQALTDHGYVNQAKVPAIPLLRPGAHLVQDGKRLIVSQVQLAGSYMNITWSDNPWRAQRD